MSSMLNEADGSTSARPRIAASRHFPATIGRFDDRADQAVIDGLTRWVEERYRADLAERPSKHVYVSTLPEPVVNSASGTPQVWAAAVTYIARAAAPTWRMGI